MASDPNPQPVNFLIACGLVDSCSSLLDFPLELELGVPLLGGCLCGRQPGCPPPLGLEPSLVYTRDQLRTLGRPPLGVDVRRFKPRTGLG